MHDLVLVGVGETLSDWRRCRRLHDCTIALGEQLAQLAALDVLHGHVDQVPLFPMS